MTRLEDLADWRGFGLHRSKARDRVWLTIGGTLFSPRCGHDEATARALLAPAKSSTPTQ
jgi:hypothetical protein